MECRYCGKKTKGGRPFCNKDCWKGWREMNRTEPGNFRKEVVASDDIAPAVRASRKDLLDRARQGDREAGRALRNHYGMTALWDGERLISL